MALFDRTQGHENKNTIEAYIANFTYLFNNVISNIMLIEIKDESSKLCNAMKTLLWMANYMCSYTVKSEEIVLMYMYIPLYKKTTFFYCYRDISISWPSNRPIFYWSSPRDWDDTSIMKPVI